VTITSTREVAGGQGSGAVTESLRRAPSAAPPVPVLLIEHSIGVSGSTVSLCTLLGRLARDRYNPCVVFSRAAQLDYLRGSSVPPTDARVIHWRNGLKSTRIGRAFYRMALRRARPVKRILTGLLTLLDIVVVVVPYTLQLYRLARRRRTALVHHNNGIEPRTVLLSRLLRVPLVVYQRGAEWHSRTARALARMVTLYVANSEATKQDLVELGVAPGRIRVIYPPVDLERFNPAVDASRQRAELGLGESEPCFGIFGTLMEWKGHHVFLRAARLVLDEVPEARVLVIGEAPEGGQAYREELLRLVQELGIAERVVFAGFREDVPELMQLLRVVVHASVTPEPFGRVIAEAMAMGKPVVATNAGGPLEIIEDGANGYLVPAGEPEAMARPIVRLLTDVGHAARIGHRARETAEARFSADTHARLVEKVYAELLARPSRSRVNDEVLPCQRHDAA
jgi:glycosyltransferase involved in cell wall biosynthesis